MSRIRTATLLWVFLALFVARVVGQLIVVLYAPEFLPPMSAWYSGMMPYKYLLPAQIFIIVQFTRITLQISSGRGYWAQPRHRLGLWLRNFGIFYFVAMIVRWLVLGLSIPVVFHWVLASYFIVLGLYHLQCTEKN